MRPFKARLFAGLGTCLLLLTIARPAHAQKITTDYDHNAAFASYHTFMWVRPARVHDPLMRQRVMDDVNSQLQAKGWQLVTADASVGVVANGVTEQEQTLNTFYDDLPGWGWRGWVGGSTTSVNNYTVGTLVVDLFDAHTKKVIWRGTASDTLSGKPEKNAKKLGKAIEKMFKDFPPAK
ncbi:MAG: DUF4136 domain-containing protein [Candidatus Acidiferrales bacterium]